MVPTLAANQYLVTGLVVVFLLVCIAMILLILIQRPQGGGLSGAFGAGGGAGQTAFGTKTGDVLTIVTIAIFVLFLLTAIVLNFAARPAEAPPPGTTARELGESAPVVGDEPLPEASANEDAAPALGDGEETDATPPPADPPVDLPADAPGTEGDGTP
jgi:preprotein translocase subunit SecG